MSSPNSRRPAPRRSTLAGQSPAAPPPEPDTDTARQQDSPRPVPPKRQDGQAAKHKVSFYQDPEDTARLRGAILYTMPYEGPRTLSEFINAAVMAEVERLEQKYNNGQPFPPVGTHELPQGRPMGR